MASAAATGPDSLISLKINHDGLTKKLKLPLRDLGASTFEDKLRSALSIHPDSTCLIERYSDSAASYVILDQANVSVYKQLSRAAKAKQKLKLRITTSAKEAEEEPKIVPKPVTVEDVPETSELPETMTKAPVEPVDDADARLAHIMATEQKIQAIVRDPDTDPEWSATLKQVSLHNQNLAKEIRLHRQLYNDDKRDDGHKSETAPCPQPAKVNASDQIPVTIGPTPQQGNASVPKAEPEAAAPATRATFAVCCNSCDRTIPEAHYHCSTCDDGDFDLCQKCVDVGITCRGDNHWLIKRFVKNGLIINSTTERIAPKPKVQKPAPAPKPEPVAPVPCVMPLMAAPRVVPVFDFNRVVNHHVSVRTCNNCVGELPEAEFVHCTTCYDFDLCKACFAKNEHGHHPKHGFVPAVEGTLLDQKLSQRLSPGRNQKHSAICDGCDKYVTGVRHKCLDCPDWDYCSDCVVNAGFIHPNHRFVPIYEPLSEVRVGRASAVHVGICCDGPLCNAPRRTNGSYIIGERYKCAVCDDTDFCANCEASPANTHNKTHPLIKFKTPVRHVSVTTTGEREDGKRMPTMGDRTRHSFASSQSRATSTASTAQDILFNGVQTVVDVKPTESAPPAEPEKVAIKEEVVEEPTPAKEPAVAPAKQPSAEDLVAVYERDTVADGTVLPPNHVFEQTWVLRNAGTFAWPAGCSVKFVSGDYMGHVDHKHPAGIRELVSASESTTCYDELQPGDEFPFTVLLRTPARYGKAISYWRLSTKEGVKFGHRLWCDVDVSPPQPKEEPATEPAEEPKESPPSVVESQTAPSVRSEESQMIFPKLDKESPAASLHEAVPASPKTTHEAEVDDFEECEVDEWAEDDSEDGFLTDEEYDILDASDEEHTEGGQKNLLKQ